MRHERRRHAKRLVARMTIFLTAAAVAAAAGAGLLATSSCDAPLFPVCSTNEECVARDGGVHRAVCYNLHCVECHYDTDCEGGRACNANTNECMAVGANTAKANSDADAQTEWSHGSWSQCAADCKDQECIKGCEEKFQK